MSPRILPIRIGLFGLTFVTLYQSTPPNFEILVRFIKEGTAKKLLNLRKGVKRKIMGEIPSQTK